MDTEQKAKVYTKGIGNSDSSLLESTSPSVVPSLPSTPVEVRFSSQLTRIFCDHGGLMVRSFASGLGGSRFEVRFHQRSTAHMGMLNLTSRVKCPPACTMREFGYGVSYPSSDHDSRLRDPIQNIPCVASKLDVNKTNQTPKLLLSAPSFISPPRTFDTMAKINEFSRTLRGQPSLQCPFTYRLRHLTKVRKLQVSILLA
ncbi:hypothetical protein AVEN_139076-1 [Araneus ventricosus]|uniref:Uncharacterized protein n=1 Tax=Araneus ventricosus TaxID=182803 RepID=A0A4Y2RN52_ARAVE|nr:hypothetical protein AVEN_139076-1 [Araneus ventricosus]